MTAKARALNGPPPVTVVIHAAGPSGGMERMAEQLIVGLLERGYTITLVACRCDLHDYPRLRWIRIPGPTRPFLPVALWFSLAAGVVLTRIRNTIVHAHGAVTPVPVDVITVHFCHHGYREVEVARASRRALAYSLNAWAAGLMSRVAERWSYRPSRVRKLVGVSDGVASELRRHFPRMTRLISVIPNGVDTRTFRADDASRRAVRRRLGVPPDALVAAFVAGDWGRKGLRFAIEAVGMTKWHLVVVGRGDTTRFKRVAADAVAADRVHFVGWDHPAPYYAAADAFVFPTRYEAFPLSVLEAAAAGLPLLVTPVNGARDLVVHGWNGWFIERNAREIAERLSELAGDPALRASMGREARSAAEAYDWGHVVDAYDRLYRELSTEEVASPGS